eukprot:COSAG03_NODE_1427_length_4098_cov_2.188797_5_plen_132_part_00
MRFRCVVFLLYIEKYIFASDFLDFRQFLRRLQFASLNRCENWRCGFHDPGGGSQNHIMYGAFDAWLVTAVGGMSTVSNTTSTAWQHIIVHTEPAAVTKLNEGSYNINTRFGAYVGTCTQFGSIQTERTARA